MKLSEISRVVRSKNAGPLTLSVDILFDTEADYLIASGSRRLAPAALADLLDRPEGDIRVIHDPRARAIKVAFPRAVVAGGFGDVDVYGAQHHAAFLDIEL